MNEIIESQYMNTCRTIDELKNVLTRYEKNTLIETLAYVIESYIINNKPGSPVTQAAAGRSLQEAEAIHDTEGFSSFIAGIKADYRFPELDLFTVDNGRVYINIENRKIEIRSQGIKPREAAKPEPKQQETAVPGETYKRFSGLEIK